MSEHVHSWLPIPGEMAKYECSCGATGNRSLSGIQEHKLKPQIQRQWTARSTPKPSRPVEDFQSWDPDADR